MCWCLRVYGTVLHNLFLRFFTNLADSVYNCHPCRRLCCFCPRCFYCCCCCCRNERDNDDNDEKSSSYAASQINLSQIDADDKTQRRLSLIEHEYVAMDDYMEIFKRKIETQSYYRTIDRLQAEKLLSDVREDGATIVRPYKEQDISIKYVVSIYAEQHFFHLFIRQIDGGDLYGIGREKANELLFDTPCALIEFYSENTLKCTNKLTTLHLKLKPINP